MPVQRSRRCSPEGLQCPTADPPRPRRHLGESSALEPQRLICGNENVSFFLGGGGGEEGWTRGGRGGRVNLGSKFGSGRGLGSGVFFFDGGRVQSAFQPRRPP